MICTNERVIQINANWHLKWNGCFLLLLFYVRAHTIRFIFRRNLRVDRLSKVFRQPFSSISMAAIWEFNCWLDVPSHISTCIFYEHLKCETACDMMRMNWNCGFAAGWRALKTGYHYTPSKSVLIVQKKRSKIVNFCNLIEMIRKWMCTHLTHSHSPIATHFLGEGRELWLGKFSEIRRTAHILPTEQAFKDVIKCAMNRQFKMKSAFCHR